MKKPLQWHPAFQAVLQIEFAEEAKYLQFLKEETSPEHPYIYRSGNARIDICYLPLDQWAGKELEWPDNLPALISGTNEGGIVWTRWRERYA